MALSTAWSDEARFVPIDATLESTSLGGATVVYDPHDGRAVGYFDLPYRGQTEAEKDAIIADYDSDPGEFTLSWNMVSPAVNHQVVYGPKPIAVRRKDSQLWDVFVRLELIPDFSDTIDDESGVALDTEGDVDLEIEAA